MAKIKNVLNVIPLVLLVMDQIIQTVFLAMVRLTEKFLNKKEKVYAIVR